MTNKKKPIKQKSKRKVNNVVDFETGLPIRLRANSRGSIKNLQELDRFLSLNKRYKIKGYILGYVHSYTDKETGEEDVAFSYIVDYKNDVTTLARMWHWLDEIKASIAKSLF